VKLTIKIDKRIEEREIVEYCLNLKCSGYEPMIHLSLYALAKGWHINKIIHYNNLLRGAF